MTRVLVVDDEAPARRRLRAMLQRQAGVEVVGESADGLQAVDAIRSLAPDVVFLDVQMPGMTGFEVIEAVGPEAMPPVVFVTAYDEYALDAFEVEAVDYLLKPCPEERLARALARAETRTGRRGEAEALARVLERVRPSRGFASRLVVRTPDEVLLLDVRQVIRLSAEGNYVRVHTAAATHLLRETLAGLESRLDPERFARVHRSDIVAIDAIRSIRPLFHGDHVVELTNGEAVRLSRRFAGRLLAPDAGRR